MLDRQRFDCVMPMESWDTGEQGSTGAPSWTSTSSPIPSSTGDRTAWHSSATCKYVGCRFRAIRGSRSRSRDLVQVRIREDWKIGSKSQTFLPVFRFRIFPVNSGGEE